MASFYYHIDVKYFSIENKDWKGLLIVANENKENKEVFEFNVLRNAIEDLEQTLFWRLFS